jgi:hypothetical protein
MSSGEASTHGASFASPDAAFQAEVQAVRGSASAFLDTLAAEGRSAGRALTEQDQRLLSKMLHPSLEFGESGEWKSLEDLNHISYGLFTADGERARIEVIENEGTFTAESISICGEQIAVDLDEVDRLLGNDTVEVTR